MGIVDWIVLGAYALLMMGIGVYYSKRNKTADDFLLGGRRMSPISLGLSLFATIVSTLSYLAHPGEMIANGPMLITQVAAHPIIFLILGYFLIPLLMRQPVTSAYEILERQLGSSIRTAGAVVFLLLRLGWMSTILFATSEVVLVPLLGVSPSWTPWLCISLGLVTAIYSSSGGIRAVVMTDAVQSITMLTGAILTLFVVTRRVGSVSAWWPNEWPSHWQEMNWGFDPSVRLSFGMLMLSTTLWYVCTNGSDQMAIQRFLAGRDASAARKTLAISQIADVCISLLLALTGVAVLGYYQINPPELADGQTLKSAGDKLFPRFIMTEMSGGMAGLVLAAILSAAMSSLSSGVNSAAGVLERDFVSRRTNNSSPEQTVRRLRVLSWLITLLAVALSLLNLLITGNLLERCFKVVNLLTAPLFVLFFLALFIKRSNAAGAWAGLICSVVAAIGIAYGEDLRLPINISFVWMMPISLVVGIFVGTGVSLLTPRTNPA